MVNGQMPHGHRGGKGVEEEGEEFGENVSLSNGNYLSSLRVLLSSINIIFDRLIESDREGERERYYIEIYTLI